MNSIVTVSDSDYKEVYRNQFHFSPKLGWMNDVNGLWYKDGLYHLTYQADEGHLNPAGVGWGHAVSTDLVHWKQLPMALHPGVNTKGCAFSGSVVIDTENTAGFGKNTVILIYTDTVLGQCMNYLDEESGKFIPYEKNPLVSMDEPGIKAGLEPAAQRDPMVFWDDNSSSWIMIVFRERDEVLDQYLQVYTSPDLKNWKRIDNITEKDFRECPNIYPLLLDGKEEKWVLQSASGRYCIGYFDGKHLVVEQDNKDCVLNGRAYAGQTFVGIPDRTVYMCWLENWGGVTVETSPWRNSSTLPYELTLRTMPDGKFRIFTKPVKEIFNLYTKLYERENAKVIGNTNLFENCRGKQIYACLSFDTKDTDAKQMLITINGKEIAVDLEKHEFHSNVELTDKESWASHEYCVKYVPFDDEFKLELFADSDSLELIFCDGSTLYCEEYGFDSHKDGFSVTLDKDAVIKKAEFGTMKSIWND